MKCQMSTVFSPRLKGVEKETLPTLPFPKEKYLASDSSPEPEQVQPCALESNSHFLLLEKLRAAPEQL